MLITNDRHSRTAVGKFIALHNKEYCLALQTANSVEAFSAADDICPQIIIIKEGLSFYNANQFIQDMIVKNPLIQYILLKDNRSIDLLSPETVGAVSAKLYIEELSEQVIGDALAAAAGNFERCSAEQQRHRLLADYPEMQQRQFRWIIQNALFAKVLNETEAPEQLFSECPSLEHDSLIMLIGEANADERGFFSYYQDIKLMGELYWRFGSLINSFGGGAVFITSEKKICFLLNIPCSEHWTENRLDSLVSDFCGKVNGVSEHLGLPPLRFCCSDMESSMDTIPGTYRAVNSLIKYHFFTGSGRIISGKWLSDNSRKLVVEEFQALMDILSRSFEGNDSAKMKRCLGEIYHMTAGTLSFASYYYVWSQLSFLYYFQVYKYSSIASKDNFPFAGGETFHDIGSAFKSLNDIFLQMFGSIPHIRVDSENPHIKNAIDYILNHISENTGLARVAEGIHISPSYLSHLFQKEFGKTYVEFNNELRIKCAANMLYGSTKVYQVAQEVGFDNSKYFSKLFKRFMGLSPREYQNHSVSDKQGGFYEGCISGVGKRGPGRLS